MTFFPLPNHAALIPSISFCPLLAKEINQWVWTILRLTFQCTDTSFVSADQPPPGSQKRQDVAPSVDGHSAQWLSDRPVSGMRHFCLFALFFYGSWGEGGDRSVTLKFSCGCLPLTICFLGFSFSLWSSIRGQRFKELIWWLLIVTLALWSLQSAARYPSGLRLC